MTVNERLYTAGLLEAFDAASLRGDVEALTKILEEVYLDQKSIEAIIASEMKKN